MRKDYMKEERNLDQSNDIVYITAIPRNMTIFVMVLYFLYLIESVYHIVSKHFSVYCVIFRFNAFPLSFQFASLFNPAIYHRNHFIENVIDSKLVS